MPGDRTCPARAAWTGSSTRCWNGAPERRAAPRLVASALLLVALLAGCSGGRPESAAAAIRSARLSADVVPALEAELELRFSRPMLEALDSGIALQLEFLLYGEREQVRLIARHRLQLRYLALAQRYQLVDRESGVARSFPRRSQLLAALDRVRLPLTPAWDAVRGGRLELALSLDRGALPGPLRLPALLSSQWRLKAQLAWRNGA